MMWKLFAACCLFLAVTEASLSLSSLLKNIPDDLKSKAFSNIQRVFAQPGPVKLTNQLLNNIGEQSKPDFCNGLDCPDYTVVQKFDKYELRQYSESHWVSTNLVGIEFIEAQRTMFYRLFDYIQGENEKKEKIAMTVPVTNRLIPGQGPACESNFTMSFYLVKAGSPQPTNKDVYLETVPAFKTYVWSFGGYPATEGQWVDEARKFTTAINGTSYDKSFYFTAGYDNPLKLLHRHNEIWFMAP